MKSCRKKEGEVENRMNRRMKEKGTGIAGGTESRGREARGRRRGGGEGLRIHASLDPTVYGVSLHSPNRKCLSSVDIY